MKESIDEIFPQENENLITSKDSDDEIKEEIKEEKEKINLFEIISDEEVKNIKKEDHELKKNIMYALNKDENIFQDSINENNLNDLNMDESLMIEFLSNKKNKFRNINPLRKQKPIEKKLEDSVKSKQLAIKELVTNLKTQYIIFNIRDFIRHYHLNANPYIN